LKSCLQSNPEIKANLSEQLSGKFENPKGLFGKLISASVPLWLVGLLATGACLYLYFDETKEGVQYVEEPKIIEVQPEPTIVYLRDTIYQVVLSEPVTITKEVVKYVEVEVPVPQQSAPGFVAGSQKELGLVASEDLSLENSSLASPNSDPLSESKGQPISDEAALMVLLDEIND